MCRCANICLLSVEKLIGKITTPAADSNRFLQCWTCGLIVGVYEAKQEVELDTLTEPKENPFKFKGGEVQTGESRKIDRTGKTQRKRKLKQDLSEYKEEDLKAAIRKGAKVISYTEISPKWKSYLDLDIQSSNEIDYDTTVSNRDCCSNNWNGHSKYSASLCAPRMWELCCVQEIDT